MQELPGKIQILEYSGEEGGRLQCAVGPQLDQPIAVPDRTDRASGKRVFLEELDGDSPLFEEVCRAETRDAPADDNGTAIHLVASSQYGQSVRELREGSPR